MATRVRSYSKVNLGLAIGPVRVDGFHGLATLYQTLALHDWVTVEARVVGARAEAGCADDRVAGERGANTGVLRFAQNDGLEGSDGLEVGDCDGRDAAAGREANAGILRFAQNDTGSKSGGGSRIVLTTNDARVPVDVRNTAWKMVELALGRMGVVAEVRIHIEKELPVQGGMGAGSANAAAALIGLERELGMALPDTERLEIAAEVGSDVPLFLVGGAVMGVGRGERVSAMEDFPATWCVMAVPEVGVSTPRAFRDWDALVAEEVVDPASQRRDAGQARTEVAGGDGASALTSDPQPDTLKELSHAYASVLGFSQTGFSRDAQVPDTSGIVRGSGSAEQAGTDNSLNGLAGNTLLALVRTGIENDFERVVFPQYPLLREIKRLLMGNSAGVSSGDDAAGSSGALYAALSGSGSALFGLYGSEMDARAAQRRVQASGCKAILTETLPRREYWRRMFAE